MAALIAFLVVRMPEAATPGEMLARSPTDEKALMKILETELDSSRASRFDTWRAAHALLARLEPNRPFAQMAYVQSGLAHWNELEGADRREVLSSAEPMLRDEQFFGRAAETIARITGDLSIVRRANPGTDRALYNLEATAIASGRFDEYRAFREQNRRRQLSRLESIRESADAAELLALVPLQPTVADTALLHGILDALRAKPFDRNRVDTRQLDTLNRFATNHGLQPLEIAKVQQPVEQWSGLCGGDICERAHRDVFSEGGAYTLRLEAVQTDQIPPYAEVLIDDALVSEGPVAPALEVKASLTRGFHRVEVRLVNPKTHTTLRRLIRVAAG